MKNIYIKTVFIFLLTHLLISCSKDFLQETPTQNVSVTDVAETGKIYPDILEGTLRGVYSMMYITGTGGTGSHEDFGQKGYDIYGDLLSGDMALTKNSYSRYSDFAQLLISTDYTFSKGNYEAWRYYYRVIGAVNVIIDSFGGNDAEITEANKFTMGQAKALRAYAYFYLTQFYIPEYTPESTYLPLYIDSTGDALPQSKTEDVYNQMIADLNAAVTLLDGFKRVHKHEVNKTVAQALLAYVYASMGTSEGNLKANELAEAVISESSLPLTTREESSYAAVKGNTSGGFNNVNSPSWLWGVDITLDAGLNLVSWWGQMDIYTFSYQWAGDKKAMDQSLYDKINSKDIRKTQFLNDPSKANHLVPNNKFYDNDRKMGGQRSIETDYIYMRVDEFYLLSAEMSAKEGMDAEARNRLKELLAKRFPEDAAAEYAYIDTLSGQDLVDEIYLQTRIELWGEGKSYLALKRNKETVVRGANHLYEVGVPILYNDDKLTLEIPQSEVQNNPFIDQE